MDLHDGYAARRVPSTEAFDVISPDGTIIGRAGSDDQAISMATRHQKQSRVKMRPCLCCGSTFRSTWVGHRLCTPCNERSAGMI